MSLDYEYHKEVCSECGRKILVEIGLFGVSHNATVSATCAQCLAKRGVHEKFRAENPTAAQDIEEWIEKDE